MWFIGVEVEQEKSAPPPKKNPGSAPEQDALADAGRPSAATDRERDGLTDEFLARHTQDMSLRGSLNQSIGTDVSLHSDISAQGPSYTDGCFRDILSQFDPLQSAGHRAQNLTLVNSAAGNENATSDPRECMLNQPVLFPVLILLLEQEPEVRRQCSFPHLMQICLLVNSHRKMYLLMNHAMMVETSPDLYP